MKAYGVLNPFTEDIEAPSIPQNVVATPNSATQITITWDVSTDNVGVVAYQLYRDDIPIDLGIPTNLFVDTGLSPSTQFSYEVSASDAAGNTSLRSSPGLGTTDPNSAPVWSITNQALEVGVFFQIDLDTVCTDPDSDPLTYSVPSANLPDGILLSGSTVSGVPTTVESPSVTLRATDNIAAPVDTIVVFDVTQPDITPPAVPTGLQVDDFGTNFIDISWTANTEPDLDTYTVYRATPNDGPYGVHQAGITSPSFQDLTLNYGHFSHHPRRERRY